MAETENLLYFDSDSMRGLYDSMAAWQQASGRRLASVSIQQDGGIFCAIALAGPVQIAVFSHDGRKHAIVSENGRLFVYDSPYT